LVPVFQPVGAEDVGQATGEEGAMIARRFPLAPLSGVAALAIAGLWLAAAPLAAQTRTDSTTTGDYLFRTYCASCHGMAAKGDGPLAASMRQRPADLTEIARRNKGVFPTEEVHRIIDGRQPVKGHGGADMPVWGDVFARTSGGGDEASITARIQALVRYLEGLQARTGS
jgi:mono/diheme cytochrome c family protein